MGAASRNKGAKAERAVVSYLRSIGQPDVRRYLAGDGRQPGDIDGAVLDFDHLLERFPGAVCLEIKDRVTYDLPAWLRQCEGEARPDQLPLVLFHPAGVADVADWFVYTRARHLLGAPPP
jgi:hypothetical protein